MLAIAARSAGFAYATTSQRSLPRSPASSLLQIARARAKVPTAIACEHCESAERVRSGYSEWAFLGSSLEAWHECSALLPNRQKNMRNRSSDSTKTPTDPLARAVNLLSRREHSPAELSAKLRAKGFKDDEVSAAVELLTERKLLSTERYVHARVQQAVSRGQGPRRLRQRLREAGLDAHTIDTQLATETEGIDWQAQAAEACERKFGSEPATDMREWNRRARFLLARGFDENSVRKVLGTCPRG